MKFRALMTVTAWAGLIAAAHAHHSFAMFDQTQKVTLKGTVTEFQWTNPHAFIHLDVPGADGKVDSWEIELNSPNNLTRQGWHSTSLKPGDKVVLAMNPLRDGSKGGLFVSVCIEMAKKVLALYLGKVPTYSVVYGAFATLPILLVWIYVAWVIVLLGAVVTAYLPSLLAGVARRGTVAGWTFQLAVEVLQQLHRVRDQPLKGLRPSQLAQLLRVDVLQLAPVLEALTALDWVGQVNDAAVGASDVPEPRCVLLAVPGATPLAPLVQRLLLDRSATLAPLWAHARLDGLLLPVVDLGHLLGVLALERLLIGDRRADGQRRLVHRLFHLAGQLAHHLVEQAHLHRAVVVGGEEQVGHPAQQLAPLGAGGLVGQGDQVVQPRLQHQKSLSWAVVFFLRDAEVEVSRPASLAASASQSAEPCWGSSSIGAVATAAGKPVKLESP